MFGAKGLPIQSSTTTVNSINSINKIMNVIYYNYNINEDHKDDLKMDIEARMNRYKEKYDPHSELFPVEVGVEHDSSLLNLRASRRSLVGNILFDLRSYINEAPKVHMGLSIDKQIKLFHPSIGGKKKSRKQKKFLKYRKLKTKKSKNYRKSRKTQKTKNFFYIKGKFF